MNVRGNVTENQRMITPPQCNPTQVMQRNRATATQYCDDGSQLVLPGRGVAKSLTMHAEEGQFHGIVHAVGNVLATRGGGSRRGSQRLVCWVCGSTEHLARNCDERKGLTYQERADILTKDQGEYLSILEMRCEMQCVHGLVSILRCRKEKWCDS